MSFIYNTALPAAFIAHVPLTLVRAFDLRQLLIALAVTAGYCAFAFWFFGRGLRHYESGNFILTRT